ncbi:MAG: anhydro-N-acetylmuramic acid kinase [Deltaproteobacteria bacterium]|nr:anhydro-N-acetylmuramic acid kinase [Deltaproteobacteria bacterium]
MGEAGGALWIGLMSGTSADAVDAALVRIGPDPSLLELRAQAQVALDEALRRRIHEAAQGTVALRDLVDLDRALGERFAEAALQVVERGGVAASQVEGIGSHGQTLGHFPEDAVRGTWQTGSPSVIHERTGIPVIADFRSADMAAGGQGAPLTPFLHHARFASADEPRAVLNIGGFTNVTFLPDLDAARVVAFDPGPGNALLDRAARAASGGERRFDRGGESALRGRVCEDAVAALLGHPYFDKAPPKSTGHEEFDSAFFERARALVDAQGGGPDDLMATLAALTVRTVVAAARRFAPVPPARWIVYGGGTENPALMRGLEERLAPAPIETSDAYGLPASAVEAVAFALLGFCGARGLPSNLPAATGARRPVSLGAATPPGAFARRPG